ncbi:hypothetical protein [Sporichthya polymorpha]|uniref:hypothetical protein n=1 Tax=Sporichthya polymorpha TaxID=35751 RepID=UPI00037C540C|nr:hypothetical protein [Sporichthya polymorpha]
MRAGLRRTAAGALVGGLLCTGAVLAGAGDSRAETTFDATAAAYGVWVTASNPNFPLGVVPEGSGPTAQARLSALPRSSALASFPYPGDGLVGLPGLIGALAPGFPPLPDYPLYANTELGDEPSAVTAPGVELAAESSDRLAAGRAQSVSAASGYVATARVERLSDGGVTAIAEARQSALALAGLATFDGIRSIAKVTSSSDAKLTRSSMLEIDSLRLPGVKFAAPDGSTYVGPEFAFRDGQFHLLPPAGEGQATPIPTDAFFDGLKAAGIEGSYQAARTTDTGIIAPVLSFTALMPAPPDNPLFGGQTKLTLDIGHAFATIAAQVIPEGPAAVAPAGTDTAVTPTDTTPAGIDAAGVPGALPSTGALPAAAPGAVPTSLVAGSGVVPDFGDLRRGGVGDIYLVLAGACLAGVLVTGLVRRGVRA